MKPPIVEVLTAGLAIGMIVEAGRDVVNLIRNAIEATPRNHTHEH